MANCSFAAFVIEGNKKEMDELHSIMKSLKEMDEPRIRNGYGKTWLGCLLDAIGVDWSKIYCRGTYTDLEYNGNISVQLIIDDIHSELLKDDEPQEVGLKLYDHRKKTNILPLVNDYVKNSKQNIMIFAESKAVKDLLTPFSNLITKTFTREKVTPCDALMFFDYPADKETFDYIIEEAHPSSIHFMNYNIKYFDDKEFLTTFIKMLRYAEHNNEGKVNFLRCSSALGKSVETVLTLLDLFEDVDFIKISEKNHEFYKIQLNEIKDLSSVLHNEKFQEVKNLIKECEKFQKNLLENDLTALDLV